MKKWTVVALALLSSTILSGCFGDKDDEEETGAATSSTTAMTTTTTPTTTTSSAPPQPKTLPGITVKYGTTNDAPKPFTVDAATTELSVKIYINSTAGGAYSVQGPGTPPSGSPYVEFKDASGAVAHKQEFDGTTGTSNNPTTIRDIPVFTIDAPGSGQWTVGVGGTGNNAQADVTITLKFT